MGAPRASRPVAERDASDPTFRAVLQAAGMTPGVWLGIGGYVLFVLASFLPWYSVSGQIPGVPPYDQRTTIIQFDGLNGLYVHDDLKAALGFGVPAVGFPIAVFFVLGAIMKIRKIIRSNEHKMRAATLTRSSIAILLPFALTMVAIFALPAIIPSAAPAQAQDLARAIAAQPFGGSAQFSFPNPLIPGASNTGTLWWGFGPALWLMVVAAFTMNLGSQLEMRVYRRVIRELEARAEMERAALNVQK
jgi:hypothetical protein